VQDQILELLNHIRVEMDMPIIMITHNLGIIAELVEQVAVMYCGMIIEMADVKSLFLNPLHPYTLGLMRAIPKIQEELPTLHVIRGMVPNPGEVPVGCRFNPRCDKTNKECYAKIPQLQKVGENHYVACLNI
jgi:oligopeptide/dipeptide ABC transporter ATP-binding protein